MGNWVERTCGKVVAGGPGGQGGSRWARQFHICMWINQEEQLGSETDHATQGSGVVK